MKIYQDIDYAGTNNPMHRLEMAVPDGEVKATYLYFHGGGLVGGSYKGFLQFCAPMLEAGIAVVSGEYRMYPEVEFPTFIEDAARAARWTFDHLAEYGLSDRVVLGGTSAGAYLVMMLSLNRSYLAQVGLEPEAFKGFLYDSGQPTSHYNVISWAGEDSRRCLIDERAALYYVTDERPQRPIQILVSENDMPCRDEQNRLLRATMIHFGHAPEDVRFHVFKGYGHSGYVYDVESGYHAYCRDFILDCVR